MFSLCQSRSAILFSTILDLFLPLRMLTMAGHSRSPTSTRKSELHLLHSRQPGDLGNTQRNEEECVTGPDGFNVEFYIATWEWIGQDVVQVVRTFFQTGIMPGHINDTHIALIPRKLVPLIPPEYRPISLCNVIYKLIAKCPANQLKPHLRSLKIGVLATTLLLRRKLLTPLPFALGRT